MKSLLLALTLILSLPVHALDVETCTNLSEVAGQTMKLRQSGVSLSKMLKGEESKLIQGITLDAYEVPHYRTKRMKDIAIEEFTEKWMLACIKSK